jgi:hypothetical protein
MENYAFFFVAFSFILVHEMDAIRQREWRLFPFLSALNDERGYLVFTAIHVPLYTALLWGLFPGGNTINRSLVIGLDIFFIIHVGLHLLFMRHPDYQFRSWLSWALILGAGVAGGADLLMRL